MGLIKIVVLIVGSCLLLYALYKNPYLILPLVLTVGVIEAIDFYRSRMNPVRMYTFKLLNKIVKD